MLADRDPSIEVDDHPNRAASSDRSSGFLFNLPLDKIDERQDENDDASGRSDEDEFETTRAVRMQPTRPGPKRFLTHNALNALKAMG